MTKLSTLFQPLRRASQAFFSSDLRLRLDGGRLRLALEDRIAPARAPQSGAHVPAPQLLQDELQLMLTQLADALDETPDARATLRHLVFVEHALHRRGLAALQKMPIEVLQRGLEQFEGLVINWSPEGLANLRSKMAVAVMVRESQPAAGGSAGPDSVFSPERIEAVLDTPKLESARVIEDARQGAFGDSTLERLALQFGVARQELTIESAVVEVQGELDPAATALRVRKLYA